MQDGTLLKENTKGRNSKFFLNQGCFEFTQFLFQIERFEFSLAFRSLPGGLRLLRDA
jgi:hypothetical protein